jgi:hypothetical protein
MPSSEYYYEPDPFDFDDGPTSNYAICYRCHKSIELLNNGVRWRAYERGGDRLHQCSPPIDPSEFTAIT